VLAEQQRTSLDDTTTMIAFEDTVVDRESELDWETLVTSTTAVANEPAPVPGAVSSGVPIVNAIGRGTAAVGGAAWQSQVTFGTQQRPVDPRAPVVQDGREGKLFLGGITWATDEDAIREYFGRFGEVTDAAVMRNKTTGVSRGFGFVTFRDAATADSVVAGIHTIDGRRVDIKPAVPQGNAPPPLVNTADGAIDGRGPPTLPNQPLPLPVGGAPKAPGAEYGGGGRVSRKFFVGGLPSSLGDADFRAHFERFGPVSDAVVMVDRSTQRSRGFGFVTFVEESSARACAATRHELHGKFVDCKQAQPGPNEGGAQPPPLPSVPPAGGGLGGHYGPPAGGGFGAPAFRPF